MIPHSRATPAGDSLQGSGGTMMGCRDCSRMVEVARSSGFVSFGPVWMQWLYSYGPSDLPFPAIPKRNCKWNCRLVQQVSTFPFQNTGRNILWKFFMRQQIIHRWRLPFLEVKPPHNRTVVTSSTFAKQALSVFLFQFVEFGSFAILPL